MSSQRTALEFGMRHRDFEGWAFSFFFFGCGIIIYRLVWRFWIAFPDTLSHFFPVGWLTSGIVGLVHRSLTKDGYTAKWRRRLPGNGQGQAGRALDRHLVYQTCSSCSRRASPREIQCIQPHTAPVSSASQIDIIMQDTEDSATYSSFLFSQDTFSKPQFTKNLPPLNVSFDVF